MPRLAPIPAGAKEAAIDGLATNSRGCRVPPVALPTPIVLAAGRLLVAGVPADEIASMLDAMADRYAAARERKESFEATIVVRGHGGEHRELRWSEDRRLGRP